jgi:HK97 family phage portal protein
MTFWENLALAFKGGDAAVRPPLGRAISTYIADLWPYPSAPFVYGPQPYAAQLHAAYDSNPVAQRSVRIVAEAVGAVPFTASDPAIYSLLTATSAGQSLLETLAAYLLLHGNGYAQLICDAQDVPVEIYALRPDRVTIALDADGWPTAYRYRVGERESAIPAADDAGRAIIAHIRGLNPGDDHYGLGCLGAAAPAVAVHNAAMQWNASILGNAARPSGALVYDPGDGSTLTPAQFDRLKAEMAAAFAGAANAGRPMLLEGGLKWQAMSLTPADMDFVALKAAAARDIALAFGVPPMLLGLPGDNSYANYREANRALWRLTVLPLAGKILAALEQALRGWWPEARLTIDRDQIPALAEDRERLWEQVSQADFLSREEKRALLGLQ